MKHIFIINPKAGATDKSEKILALIDKAFQSEQEEYFEFVTEYEGHATELVRDMCVLFEGEHIRFYACGGLGTVCEVLNGIRDFNLAELAVYPIVPETDIIAAFPLPGSDFCSIEALKNGKTVKIDLIKCNNFYAINHVNFGIDAKIGKEINNSSLRSLGFFHSKLPYLLSAFKNFSLTRTLDLIVNINGIQIQHNCSIAVAMNGIRYGRAFYPDKSSKIDDGLMNILFCYIPTKFFNIKILDAYKQGNTSENQKVFVHYKSSEMTVRLKDGSDLLFNYDGLDAKDRELKLSILPKILKFVLPEALPYEN